MFLTKLYKYDSTEEANGYRGEDFTPYVLQSATFNEDITQELDTQEITLNGLPFSEEFAPETKFIADIVEQLPDQEIIHQTIHLCVSSDMVNKPILSDDNYYNHHIFFIEPSVVAQKRLVDNISVTYKLKDVSLEQQVAYPIDTPSSFVNQSSAFTPSENFGKWRTDYFLDQQIVRRAGKYLQYEGDIKIYNPDDLTTEIDKKYINVSALKDITTDPSNPQYQATITIPRLAIYGGLENSTQIVRIGYASIDVTIEEYSLTDSYNPISVRNEKFISRSNLAADTNFYQPYYNDIPYSGVPYSRPAFLNEWLFEYGYAVRGTNGIYFQYRKYTDISAQRDPTYQINNVIIKPDRNYKITVKLHEFSDNLPDLSQYPQEFQHATRKYDNSQPTSSFVWDNHKARGSNIYNYDDVVITRLTNAQTNGITEYTTYTSNSKELVYTSAIPYSALALLQKAIVNSCSCEKESNVYSADVNNMHLPFYIDPNYVTKLSATTIIENFYNQKNLWEVAIDVGHYIHAIPELKFGSDDRFMFTFNELGRTDQKEDNATKISIFNSRSVEDYICATSSYVSNMVQLGGFIEEWVVPKTNAETLLVSNDTANLKTTKPIIELLNITVKNRNDGTSADFTPFVYEKNVYDTLSVLFTDYPNRGVAMYYQLGTNSIDGGDYRTPTPSSGDKQNDYAFKKAIYSAFHGYIATPSGDAWTTIKIDDYVFKITYRTKETARMNHLRPDLRKYLLNSQYDRYPQHNQFNNQQDVLIDSIKFGNNLYGKLIKTGNSEYTINEWESDFANVKHKGELYRINGDLYYVAKATHEIQSNCIISKIKYSKDYNELSAVIGIPSEPRFYEISEQSQIRREFAMNDLLLLTNDLNKVATDYNSSYVSNYTHLMGLIFRTDVAFLKYALTVFKGDKDVDKYDQTVGQGNLYLETFVPINAYSSGNTLSYEWDMVDNFSAGDQVQTLTENYDGNYSTLWAVKYTDIYGKAALVDFYLMGDFYVELPFDAGIQSFNLLDSVITNDNIQAFPESPFKTRLDTLGDSRRWVFDTIGGAGGLMQTIAVSNISDPNDTDYNGRGICLLKDCREAISCNYNLQLITDSDKFVVSPFVFLPNKSNVKIAFLSEEINKLTDGYIDTAKFIDIKNSSGTSLGTLFDIETATEGNNKWSGQITAGSRIKIDWAANCFAINPKHFTGEDGYTRVKAIAIVCNVSLSTGEQSSESSTIPNKTQLIIGRNVANNDTYSTVMTNWYIGAPKKNIFTNKQ